MSILLALPIISSSKSWGDLLDIKYFGLYRLIILRLYACFGYKVYFPVKQFFQLIGQVNKLNANGLAKVNHDVNIAIRLKIVSDNRAEKADGIDMVLFR
jgi:hypothetical protein